jgi:L-fuculose-phosphate aldolase
VKQRVDDAAGRLAIVLAGARLGRRGLIAAGEGNLSIRLPGARMLITPGGRRKDELRPEDLVTTRLTETEAAAPDGAGLRPSSDIAIHRAIYLARPDALAIVHAHVPAAMALTVAGEVPDPASLPETALLLPRLPFVPYGTPGSLELAARIVAALLAPPEPLPGAAILKRHGAIAIGTNLDEALDRMELVDVLCRVWRDAVLLRAARGRDAL